MAEAVGLAAIGGVTVASGVGVAIGVRLGAAVSVGGGVPVGVGEATGEAVKVAGGRTVGEAVAGGWVGAGIAEVLVAGAVRVGVAVAGGAVRVDDGVAEGGADVRVGLTVAAGVAVATIGGAGVTVGGRVDVGATRVAVAAREVGVAVDLSAGGAVAAGGASVPLGSALAVLLGEAVAVREAVGTAGSRVAGRSPTGVATSGGRCRAVAPGVGSAVIGGSRSDPVNVLAGRAATVPALAEDGAEVRAGRVGGRSWVAPGGGATVGRRWREAVLVAALGENGPGDGRPRAEAGTGDVALGDGSACDAGAGRCPPAAGNAWPARGGAASRRVINGPLTTAASRTSTTNTKPDNERRITPRKPTRTLHHQYHADTSTC